MNIIAIILGLIFGIAQVSTPNQSALSSPENTSLEAPAVISEQQSIAQSADIDPVQLAQCLQDKGVIMYGASWCPHCQNQKQAFGVAANDVPYQECDANTPGGDQQKCIAAGVTGYPTWQIPGQEPLVGEQTLSQIAELAGCQQ